MTLHPVRQCRSTCASHSQPLGSKLRLTVTDAALPPARPSGEKYLLDDEAVQVGGTNHSHATKDLYDAIAAGGGGERGGGGGRGLREVWEKGERGGRRAAVRAGAGGLVRMQGGGRMPGQTAMSGQGR